MLVFARKPGQSIVLGDDIVVTIVELRNGRVQLGVQAPKYVPVFRQEIVDRMRRSGEVTGAPHWQPAGDE